MRKEQEIFDDLARLCLSPGYAHAIACLCFENNMVFYKEKITADDVHRQYSSNRLIRTELSTLVGLLVKRDIDYTFPGEPALRQNIEDTESLLKELQDSMLAPIVQKLDLVNTKRSVFEQFGIGQTLREPVFYGGESAYSFQYRELALKKYAEDNEWLKATKGFSIEGVRDVAQAIQKIQDDKMTAIRARYPDKWPLFVLTGYTFTIDDVAGRIRLVRAVIKKILTEFAVPSGQHNAGFAALNDFNVTNATPLIRYNDDSFVLFQQFSLVEATYESPYYWMNKDPDYRDTAAKNRGHFTEKFCQERLESVFGNGCVYSNVKIVGPKKTELGEIDVLVLFGDRAIVLQAKSKRLTLEARKGNDGQIKGDFRKSVQDSYNQGYRDATLLRDEGSKLVDSDSNEIVIRQGFKEVYILCVVSDHYPALSFQTQAFLQFEKTDVIHPPFVMDVFTLDAMTEMLQSPLWLLSYINRRVNYFRQIHASNELVILSDHIKNNLWINDKRDLAYLNDDLVSDLETAMTVRREGIPGDRTPDGFLARYEKTALGYIVKMLGGSPDLVAIDLGFMLLTLSEKTVAEVSEGLGKILDLTKKDGKGHDFTIGIREGGTGLTVHCNDEPMSTATGELEAHCAMRKDIRQADSWFGVCISSKDGALRFGLCL